MCEDTYIGTRRKDFFNIKNLFRIIELILSAYVLRHIRESVTYTTRNGIVIRRKYCKNMIKTNRINKEIRRLNRLPYFGKNWVPNKYGRYSWKKGLYFNRALDKERYESGRAYLNKKTKELIRWKVKPYYCNYSNPILGKDTDIQHYNDNIESLLYERYN